MALKSASDGTERKRIEWLPENKFCASGVARAHSRANTNAIGVVAAGIAANRACVLYRWLLVGALWARATNNKAAWPHVLAE